MKRILKIGMDVHTTNYTLCAMEPVIGEEDRVFATIKVTPDYKNILMFIEDLKLKLGLDNEYDIQCGYEAGCLGYSLYNQLTAAGVKCVILAPTTMLTQQGVRIKTDMRDALMIAQCLSYGGYHAVYIPTEDDNSVKEYLRMRNDHKIALKKIKQQINAFCLKNNKIYPGNKSKWTQAHVKWLNALEFDGYMQDAFNEYMITYRELTDKVERLESQIEQLAELEEYRDKVKKLICIKGIKTHTALSLIVETGDFSRFQSAERYASYIGLVPGEHSSSEDQNRLGITKAGNRHMRMLLTEAAQCYSRGVPAKKSKDLKSRQKGASPEVIAYADKASIRLRRKYIRMELVNKKKANVAKIAVARELACFIWGMMTDNIA